MFKKGFTLAETLISLTIIGVIAALTMPGLLNSRPNKSKAMFLKAYNTLTTQIVDILSDPSLYYTTYDANGNPNCSGLGCTSLPTDPNYSDSKYSGKNKFVYLFASRLNLQGSPTESDGEIIFRTMDGLLWTFQSNSSGSFAVLIETSKTSHALDVDSEGGITPRNPQDYVWLREATSLTN